MRLLEQTITRRGFIKVSGTTAAIATLGPRLFGAHAATLIEGKPKKPVTGQDEWIPTACRMCRIHDGISVQVKDGVALRITGNPADPRNRGRNCGKSQAGLTTLYNPYRIKAPMKRTNPQKGMGVDPGWVEITWDEALNTVAAKMKEVYDENPREFAFSTVFGSIPYMALGTLFTAFKTPNFLGWGPGEMCGGGLHFAPARMTGSMVTAPDTERCNYYINFGGCFDALGKGAPGNCGPMIKARNRGMKFVAVDPLCSTDGVLADEWIPIRPGTDQAFALAMANVLVNELGRYDEWSLKNRTNAPYLIGPDGFYVRSKTEMMIGPDPIYKQKWGKPLIWDAKDNKAKVFDDKSIQDFALEGSYTVDGVSCKPAFQVMKETIKQYTPEWAEGISTVPASTIRRIATEFIDASQIGSWTTIDGVKMPLRPSAVCYGKGAQGHYHAALTCRTFEILNALAGNFGVPGGTIQYIPGLEPYSLGPDGLIRTAAEVYPAYRFKYPAETYSLYDIRPMAHSTGSHIADAVLHPEKYGLDYKIKVFGFNMTNPLTNMYNYKMIEKAWKTFPFIWSISYHFDDPTEFSDVVLPEESYLERLSPIMFLFDNIAMGEEQRTKLFKWRTVLMQPVVEPLYNTKGSLDTLIEIADRMGILKDLNNYFNMALMMMMPPYLIDPNKKYPWEEILDHSLKAQYGRSKGLDWFKKNGLFGYDVPKTLAYNYARDPRVRAYLYDEFTLKASKKFREDTQKVNYHVPEETFKEFDSIATCSWRGLGPVDNAPPEYDLYAINWNGGLNVMGMMMEDHWRHEYLNLYDPKIYRAMMHPDTAAKKGLKDGDVVFVEALAGNLDGEEVIGKVEGQVMVTQCIHPECVGIGGRFGVRSKNAGYPARDGMCFNDLISFDEETFDPLSGNVNNGPKVKVYKA